MTMTTHTKVRGPIARTGFTLVEMLVVIAIIGVLAALLIPVVASSLAAAKNTALSVEMTSIANAIEKYKAERGDYPPSFGEGNYEDDGFWNNSVLRRHIVTAYPKIDQNELRLFRRLANHLSQSEALVFFLTLTRDDPRFPFFGASYPRRANIIADLGNADFVPFTRDSSQAPPTQASTVYGTPATPYVNASPYKNYGFSLDQARLMDMTDVSDLDDVPSYVGKNCKAAVYLYCDARTYYLHFRDLYGTLPAAPGRPPITSVAVSGEGAAANTPDKIRPYFSDQQGSGANAPFAYQNPQSFQLIAAGLDGRFTNSGDVLKKLPSKRSITPSNSGQNHQDGGPILLDYWVDDRDNIANFSNGKKLDDLAP